MCPGGGPVPVQGAAADSDKTDEALQHPAVFRSCDPARDGPASRVFASTDQYRQRPDTSETEPLETLVDVHQLDPCVLKAGKENCE